MTEIQGKSILVRVSARFELARVRVTGSPLYYGMSRGHSLSINARLSGKKRTSMYISREKGDHYYIQTRHNDLSSFLYRIVLIYICKPEEGWYDWYGLPKYCYAKNNTRCSEHESALQ